jgi:hypothetical protein
MATNTQPPLVQQGRSYAETAKENTQQTQQNQNTIQQTQAEILLAQAIAKMEQMMTVVMESRNNMTKMITALITKNSILAQNLKIAHWNANGLGKHSQEIK